MRGLGGVFGYKWCCFQFFDQPPQLGPLGGGAGELEIAAEAGQKTPVTIFRPHCRRVLLRLYPRASPVVWSIKLLGC